MNQQKIIKATVLMATLTMTACTTTSLYAIDTSVKSKARINRPVHNVDKTSRMERRQEQQIKNTNKTMDKYHKCNNATGNRDCSRQLDKALKHGTW